MPTAEAEIAKLDRMLASRGEDVILQRITGTANQAVASVTCRGFVRGYAPHELLAIPASTQADCHVVIGPTEILAAQWPGARIASSQVPDPSLPRQGDKLVIAGKPRTIQRVDARRVAGTLVRIDMQVAG